MSEQKKTNLSLEDWCRDIQTNHHEWSHRHFPRLIAKFREAAAEMGGEPSEFWVAKQALEELWEDLAHHMQKEERVLFPLIRFMELTRKPARELAPCPGSLVGPLHVMHEDHSQASKAMEQLSQCLPALRREGEMAPLLMEVTRSLEEVLENLRLHMHKEDDILFVKAMELEVEIESQCPPFL